MTNEHLKDWQNILASLESIKNNTNFTAENWVIAVETRKKAVQGLIDSIKI